MRIKQIGDATLYNCDIRELPHICADLVVTDPPYELTAGGCTNTDNRMSGKFNTAEYDNGGHIVPCSIKWGEFMPMIYNMIGKQAHAYIMCNNRHIQNMLNAAEKAGFGFHNMLIWQKDTATPNRWYMKNCEFAGLFYKGKAFHINDCGHMQLTRAPNPTNEQHPTVKPVSLMRHYIENSSKSGQLVVDPFMGSGTTGVAALQAGRKFIGCEMVGKYFDIACERIEQATTQGELL